MAQQLESIYDETQEAIEGEPNLEANPSAERVTFLTVLKNRGFRNLWLGQVVSQIGDYFAFLAMLVVVSGFSQDAADVTRSVSGMMVAITLPRLFFGVIAGVFVDRWDRRRTMIVSDILRAVLAMSMIPAFLSKNLLLMYALAFVMSGVGTLFIPAKSALIPKLVPENQLLSANSLSQTSMMLANFIGPALAGATFALAGSGNEWVAFVIDAASFVVSAIAILFIVMPKGATNQNLESEAEAPSGSPKLNQVWEELVVGLKALFFGRVMATLAVVFAVTMLGIGAINVLWIAFLKTNFGFQSAELAWRISIVDIAFAVGMVAASIGVGNFLSHIAPKWFVVWGLLIAGIVTTVLGYIPEYWMLVIAMFVVGAFVAPIQTGASTLMQVVVPNSQLGRVGGGLGTITDTATLTSMSLAGVLGAWLGIPFVFLLGGLLCAASGILAWVMLPPLTMKDKVEEETQARGLQPVTSDR